MFRRCSFNVQAVLSAAIRHYRKIPRLDDLPDADRLPVVALVGRPNVGKSALFNRLVKKRDALVFDTPDDHVTRDYREGLAQLGDMQFKVVDTSGLEPAAAPRTLQVMTKLELQMANLALSQGKALVVALNKADAIPGGLTAAAELRDKVAEVLEARFLQAGRLPVLSLSALQGVGAQQLLDTVLNAYDKWNKRVSSYRLRSNIAKHSLRFYGTGGTANLLQRIKWAAQLKSRPPTFVMLLRGSEQVDEGAERFLATLLRDSLGLHGVPIRLYLRQVQQ
eukprot:gene6377-6609_t